MELSSAIREYLSAPRFAVLATINPSGVAQQTVMWYALDHDQTGDTIMMNTTDTRQKAGNLRRDARVSICVPDGYRYVTVTGTATLIDDQAVAQRDIRRLAVRYDGEEAGNKQADEFFSKQRRVTIRVPIERVITHGVGE
jgi:PPOX class probable F420-dependent enzyme